MTDFTYTTNGFFYRLTANNDSARNELHKFLFLDDYDADIPPAAWKNTLKRLKTAGYSVIKADNPQQSNDDLLRDLGIQS